MKRYWTFSLIRLRVWIVLIVFQLSPRFAYKFSQVKCIPDKGERIPKIANPLDEFEILRDISTEIPQLDSINIVLKGASFDRSRIKDLKGPTFLINWWNEEEGENIIYTTGGGLAVEFYTDLGLSPIWSVDHVWLDADGTIQDFPHSPKIDRVFEDPLNQRVAVYHQINNSTPSSGSGVISVVALCKLAKEINIYGWDHYINFEPAKSNYWKLLLGMLAFTGSKAQPDVVEMALYGWNYCNRISQLPFVNVHSYLGQLDHHPKMVRKLEKIFYEG